MFFWKPVVDLVEKSILLMHSLFSPCLLASGGIWNVEIIESLISFGEWIESAFRKVAVVFSVSN